MPEEQNEKQISADLRVSLSRISLAKNTLINFAGFVLPLAVGLITIPLIVSGFGVERFGLLTLAWAIIGYFSLFDLGLGRAIIRRHGAGRNDRETVFHRIRFPCAPYRRLLPYCHVRGKKCA